MFISRTSLAQDADSFIAVTMQSISAGKQEVAAFCAGTGLAVWTPPPRHRTGPRPVDDLSWWKPFLQLRGPERIAGPEEAKRLFKRDHAPQTHAQPIIIDHAADDIHVSSVASGAASMFATRSRRSEIICPREEPPAWEAAPGIEIVAERVTAPVELRFFPNRSARTERIFDC